MTLTDRIRQRAANGEELTVADILRDEPRAKSVPQIFQRLERTGEFIARRVKGRGHAGVRKVYRAAEARGE